MREQDEAITAEQLVKQVNAVPDRPEQNPKVITYILNALKGTVDHEGETRMKKCWNVTNRRDASMRAFGYKQLMGFLPTLERQRAWYPHVYDCEELYRCAKCLHLGETPDHIYECADHTQVELCFRDRYRALQPQVTTAMDPRELLPWRTLGRRQGRVDPSWENEIASIQQRRGGSQSIAGVTIQLLRASLETWYVAIWLPRCQRTIEQERQQGLHQKSKIRQMRTANRGHGLPSPTPKLPPSFILSILDRRTAYRRFLSQMMLSVTGH